MRLSERLETIARMVSKGNRVVDVGTDHAFLPIYLVKNHICIKVIAMDIKKGPLQKAKENIAQYGLTDVIETRISDGISALHKNEVDTLIIAGVGGNVMIHILTDGHLLIQQMEECILQPQSEIAKLRRYLMDNGYHIIEEDMVVEDGKFYPMMKVIPNVVTSEEEEREIFVQYGKLLLQNRHVVLKQYLEKELVGTRKILFNLKLQANETVKRIEDLEQKERLILEALSFY